MTQTHPDFPPPFSDIAIANPEERSAVYQVLINGEPVRVLRSDGREGPIGYVHGILYRPCEVSVHFEGSGGSWRVCRIGEPPDVRDSGNVLSFDLSKPGPFLIETGSAERLYLLADAPEDNPPKPGEPGVFSILDTGVEPSVSDLQTERLQAAIDAVGARPGGGVLHVPPGVYRTGTLFMRTGVRLHLPPGALLQGSPDPSDYPLDPGPEPVPDRTEDIRARLILFNEIENAGISGRGEIHGMGHVLRAQLHQVPNLIRIRRCQNIQIEGVTLRGAAGWNTHVFHSERVTLQGIRIFGNWSDGIDVDNSRDVLVENVLSSSFDDAFTIKATWFQGTAERVGNIVLRNSLLWTRTAAIKIGTETAARVIEDFTADGIAIAGCREALTIKCCDGADVRNIRYRNIQVHPSDNTEHAILFEMHARNGKGHIRNISIRDLNMEKPLAVTMTGLDAEHTVSEVGLERVWVGGKL